MKWDVSHRIRFVYSRPAHDSFNEVRLEPPSNPGQSVESFSLRISPEATVSRYADFYGNWAHHCEVLEEHLYLLVESRTRVRTHPLPPLPPDAEPCPMGKLDNLRWVEYCHDFMQSSGHVELGVDLWRLAVDVTVGKHDVWQAALSIMHFVHGYLKYDRHSDPIERRIKDVIARRGGTRQDYAHLMIGLCRSVKIPARYVTGYLGTGFANGTHAWVEIYIPTAGWIGLDPTHNCQVADAYVKVGIGRDFADVPPVAGNYRGTLNRRMEVDVNIEAAT